jgi:hypothetical protein
METLTQQETTAVVDRLPTSIQMILQQHPEAAVAGGLVRDTLLNSNYTDIDIFTGCACPGEAIWGRSVTAYRDRQGLYSWHPASLDGGLKPTQLIRISGDPVDHMVTNFDFVCCGGLVRWQNDAWVGVAVDGFHEALANRTLTLLNPSVVRANSLRRLVKLVGKGFVPTDETLTTIATALVLALPCSQEYMFAEDVVQKQMANVLARQAQAAAEPPENWQATETVPVVNGYGATRRAEAQPVDPNPVLAYDPTTYDPELYENFRNTVTRREVPALRPLQFVPIPADRPEPAPTPAQPQRRPWYERVAAARQREEIALRREAAATDRLARYVEPFAHRRRENYVAQALADVLNTRTDLTRFAEDLTANAH